LSSNEGGCSKKSPYIVPPSAHFFCSAERKPCIPHFVRDGVPRETTRFARGDKKREARGDKKVGSGWTKTVGG